MRSRYENPVTTSIVVRISVRKVFRPAADVKLRWEPKGKAVVTVARGSGNAVIAVCHPVRSSQSSSANTFYVIQDHKWGYSLTTHKSGGDHSWTRAIGSKAHT